MNSNPAQVDRAAVDVASNNQATARRFADADSARRYPFDITGPAAWSPQADRSFRFDVDLPAISAGHVIVPSFAMLDAPYRYNVALVTKEQTRFPLVPVPSTPADRPAAADAGAAISCHVDYFRTTQPLQDARLEFCVTAATTPARYLLGVTTRLEDAQAPAAPAGLRTGAAQPPAISQMLAPATIRSRICSPVATAMALSVDSPGLNWRRLVDACLDEATGMYGVWPGALWGAATQCQRLGMVETFSGWPQAIDVLNRGWPIVASIRFAAGKLEGAPLNSTGGHLVLLTAIAGDQVRVLDPAGASVADVPRNYGLQQFGDAWFSHRGAGYVFLPADGLPV